MRLVLCMVAFSITLPPSPFSANPDYPMARNVAGAITASERLPLILPGVRNKPALYRFTIYDGPSVERFYIGETVHSASRMGQYCGVIRRRLPLSLCISRYRTLSSKNTQCGT